MIEELLDRVQSGAASPLLRKCSEEDVALRFQSLQLLRLKGERMATNVLLSRPRVAATACWEFPIYSQTFVYQELAQLIGNGFHLRFLYSKLTSRDRLPSQFHRLWQAKRKLIFHPSVCRRAYDLYRQRMPEKIDILVEKICRASGISRQELCSHHHFLEAFAFTQTVEACRPQYLHSYFFYEGTLFTLFASWLLDIPRGVSCYADHMLADYVLKVVPLHMEQCSVVVATSERIKRELLQIAPQADPDRIVVKPNAIDTDLFPQEARKAPASGEPYRLICVSRIEPKKGLIYLVQAMRDLLDRGMRVELHLVGGVDENISCQDYARQVESRIDALHLRDVIHLQGRKPESEVRRLLSESHLFIAPFVETESGDKDGIPTALLEAMSSGIAVIATDAGSISEVITADQDGILIPQRDSTALAGAIEALLANPNRRNRIAANAADKIRRCFDVSVCERRFHDRIRAVVDDRVSQGAAQ